jgi:NADH-quinone oxidoreductase subunit G
VEGGRLADRAGIRGQRPEADQGRPRRASIGTLASPHSTVEELFLAGALVRGLGSENIDYRLRNASSRRPKACVGWAPRIASLSDLQRVLVVGSNLRKDHPLFALRIRAGRAQGRAVSRIHDVRTTGPCRWRQRSVRPPGEWAQLLADVATAIAGEKGAPRPCRAMAPTQPRPSRPRCCRRAQGHPAGQRRRASRQRVVAAGAGAVDRRSHRRHRRLPHRSRQHGRRAAGARRVPGRRPERGPDAGRRPEGRAPAEHRTRVRLRRRRRAHGWPLSKARWSSRSARSRPTWPSATCCCPSRRSPRRPAPSSTPKAACRASTPWSSRWAKRVRPGRCCACWATCSACRLRFDSAQRCWPPPAARPTCGKQPWCRPTCCPTARRAKADDTGQAGAPVTAAIYQLDGIVRRAESLQLTADARKHCTQAAAPRGGARMIDSHLRLWPRPDRRALVVRRPAGR